MNKFKFETIRIPATNYYFEERFLLTLEEIQKWFDYSTVIYNERITLSSNSNLDEYNSIYDDMKSYLADWISTLKDAMADDENIDYSDWLNVLQDPTSYKIMS